MKICMFVMSVRDTEFVLRSVNYVQISFVKRVPNGTNRLLLLWCSLSAPDMKDEPNISSMPYVQRFTALGIVFVEGS